MKSFGSDTGLHIQASAAANFLSTFGQDAAGRIFQPKSDGIKLAGAWMNPR